MTKINLTLIGMPAVWAFIFTLGAGPVHGQDVPPPFLSRSDDNITKTLTFPMPACPIKAITVPPTKTPFLLPGSNPLGAAFSVAGTVQITDQSGATVFLITGATSADSTGVAFARTVNTITHATGSLTFDRGCMSSDPYGSNNCTWTWGETVTAAYQGALQEDITAGKLIVNLHIDNNKTPFSFSCPVCGASCPITIPKQFDHASWDAIWILLIGLIRLALGLL